MTLANESHKKLITVNWLFVILMFFYVYTFQVEHIPGAYGTMIIVSIIMFICALYKENFKLTIDINNKISKSCIVFWAWQLILLLYTYLIISFVGTGDGRISTSDYIYMLAFFPLGVFGFSRIFNTPDKLMRAFYFITLTQCTIILLGWIFPAFREWVNTTFNTTGYWANYGWDYLHSLGYATGLACATSKGALQLSLGSIACIYFIIQGNKKYYLPFIFFTIMSVAVARVSVVVAMVGIGIVLLKGNKEKFGKGIAMALGIIIAFSFAIFIAYHIWESQMEVIFQRFLKLLQDGIWNSYLGGYVGGKNSLPALTWSTVFGTGVTEGYSGNGIYVSVDGGYLRNYVSMGLIVAVINYLLIISLFKRLYKSVENENNKFVLLYMFAVFFIGEFKEYFIYTFYFMIFIFVFAIICFEDHGNAILDGQIGEYK